MSDIKEKTLKLIDGLKATCQSYGMGNDGNEYKIITQVFLYKFLNWNSWLLLLSRKAEDRHLSTVFREYGLNYNHVLLLQLHIL